MFDSFTFWLIVLAVLIAYLGVSLGVHAYIQEVRQRHREREFEGHGFQVSTIARRVEQVRQDHLGFTQNRPKDSSYRTELITSARRMLIGMSFFQRERSEDEIEKEDT